MTAEGEPVRNLVRCPGCRAFGYDGDQFCFRCGMALQKRCPACRTVIAHPIASYCSECGASLGKGEVKREDRDPEL